MQHQIPLPSLTTIDDTIDFLNRVRPEAGRDADRLVAAKQSQMNLRVVVAQQMGMQEQQGLVDQLIKSGALVSPNADGVTVEGKAPPPDSMATNRPTGPGKPIGEVSGQVKP